MDKIDIRDLIIRELKKEEIQLDHYNNAVLKHDYIKVAESIVEKLPIYNVLKGKLEGITDEINKIEENLILIIEGFEDAKKNYGYDLANETYYIEQIIQSAKAIKYKTKITKR